MIKYRQVTPLKTLAVAVALCGLNSVQAEESFTVSGPLTYAYYYDYSTGTYDYRYDGSFEATVTHNPSVPEQYSEYENPGYYKYGQSLWYDAVTTVDYRIYDTSGVLISENQVNTDNDDYTQSFARSYMVDYQNYYYYQQDYKQELFYKHGYSYAPSYKYHYAQIYSYDFSSDVTVGPQQYPDLSDNLDWDGNVAYMYEQSSNHYSYFQGIFDAVTGGDTDGDGVPDGEDACIESDLTPTVVVDSNNTGVTNHLLANGCTITDMIAEIQAAEERHGQVVSGVAHFLNAIKDDETISGKDKGKIQSAVAKTNGKGKNK